MEANRDKNHNKYLNHTHRQMLSLLKCFDDVFTSEYLKYGRIRIRAK